MEPIDIREKGGVRAGVQQTSEKRLFMQVLAYGNVRDTAPLVAALEASGISGVLYEDANDPLGVGVLTWSDDPAHFVGPVRKVLSSDAFAGLTQKHEYTMLGRTYALGHEPNLEDWLMLRSPRAVSSPEWPWHVWYPLRRKGEFATLPQEDQTAILREHGTIGHAYGTSGYAQDVRLACFGIDKNDNDFVIGLIGKELAPLSLCVQAMRKTRQTSTLMEKMGPFFVGRAIWQKA